MVVKAVQELAIQYQQVERKIYQIREESTEKEALAKQKNEIQSQLMQIFEQCDKVLGITKEYKRERVFQSVHDCDSEVCCLD